MIRRELGELVHRAGGYVTNRLRDENGTIRAFELQSADGYGESLRFLDLTGQRPRMDLEVFSGAGADYLRRAGERSYAVLDEIGGVELLDETFMDELGRFLQGSQPGIGVMKGPGPAGKLVEMMGLTLRYELARRALYEHLRSDPNTLLLELNTSDDLATLCAVREWVQEYAK